MGLPRSGVCAAQHPLPGGIASSQIRTPRSHEPRSPRPGCSARYHDMALTPRSAFRRPHNTRPPLSETRGGGFRPPLSLGYCRRPKAASAGSGRAAHCAAPASAPTRSCPYLSGSQGRRERALNAIEWRSSSQRRLTHPSIASQHPSTPLNAPPSRLQPRSTPAKSSLQNAIPPNRPPLAANPLTASAPSISNPPSLNAEIVKQDSRQVCGTICKTALSGRSSWTRQSGFCWFQASVSRSATAPSHPETKARSR